MTSTRSDTGALVAYRLIPLEHAIDPKKEPTPHERSHCRP